MSAFSGEARILQTCRVKLRDVSAAGAAYHGTATDPQSLVRLAADGGAHHKSPVGTEEYESVTGRTERTRHLEGVVT